MSNPRFPPLNHLAPVVIVDRVEPCVAFWVERFGFEAKSQVPGLDDRLLFASVTRGDIEIMYQTRASVLAERPDAEEFVGHSTVLFFTVPNLDAVERVVAGAPVFKSRHQTPYGSTELYVRDPGGTTVGFAQFS